MITVRGKTVIGPNISTLGLVLHLDSNSRSFTGEPTTNLLSNPTNEVIGTSSEFVQYADLAPIFDTYGTAVTYSLSLDLKSAVAGSILVYMQNGSSSKYSFVSSAVNATTSYQRFTFDSLHAVISTPTDIAATLAFYGEYGSGRISSIKNVQVEIKDYATPFVNGTRGSTPETGGGWLDLSGNNNHGTLYGTIGTATFSNAIGLNFNVTGKYIAGTITNNQPTTNATLESWIYPKAELETGDGMGTVILISGGASIYQSLYKSTPPQLASYWYSHTPEGYHINGASNRDQWHHWCSVWNYVDQKLYQFVDGVKVGNISTFGNAASGPSYNIGHESDGRQYSGGIANIKVYNTALTDSEVLQNYNSTKSRFGL